MWKLWSHSWKNLKNQIIGDFLKNKEIIGLVDFTLLKREKTKNELEKFLLKANEYRPPAVCIFTEDILNAKKILDSGIQIAAVVGGFPEGSSNCDEIKKEIRTAIQLGADELDFVADYNAFKRQDILKFSTDIKECTALCLKEGKSIKWIIETGALSKEEVKKISKFITDIVIEHFSSKTAQVFLKTSTGYYGGFGATVKRTEDFVMAYEQAVASGLLSVIELQIDDEVLSTSQTISEVRNNDK